MAKDNLPYSRLTEAMPPEPKDDDPANLEDFDGKAASGIMGQYKRPVVTDAGPDVGASAWAMSETYRRINCRGK